MMGHSGVTHARERCVPPISWTQETSSSRKETQLHAHTHRERKGRGAKPQVYRFRCSVVVSKGGEQEGRASLEGLAAPAMDPPRPKDSVVWRIFSLGGAMSDGHNLLCFCVKSSPALGGCKLPFFLSGYVCLSLSLSLHTARPTF